MGNLHQAIQVLPTYYEGVAIEVKEVYKQSFTAVYKAFKNRPGYIHLKGVAASHYFFCDALYEHKKLFLVLQHFGGSGCEAEALVPMYRHFATYLQDALFFINDEYAGFIDRYEISSGELAYERVVEAGEYLMDYLTALELDALQKYGIYIGRSLSLKRSGDKSKAMKHPGAAKDDYKEALEFVDLALAVKQDSPEALFQKISILYDLEQWAACEQHCYQYLQKWPEPGKMQDKTSITDQQPQPQRVHYMLGLLYKHPLQKPGAAAQHYRKVLNSEEEWYINKSRFALSDLFFREGKFEEGMQYCDDMLKHATGKDLTADALYGKSCGYALQGNKEEGLCYLAIAIRLKPYYKTWVREDKDWQAFWEDERFKQITET
ncbi:MAG: hypothetical protein MI921_13100 [Cytophagales bacterium]|nr:hypothetical protein [Cytophagales bacterium]